MQMFWVLAAHFLLVAAQQPGHMEQEENPTVRLTECVASDDCTHKDLKVTLDANWRWVHHSSGYENCYTGNQWNSKYCADPAQCASQCVLEGVTSEKYRSTYGIEQIDNGVKLKFVTDHQYGTNVGSRLYMLDESGERYKMFFLKNREFAMTFDVSQAMCGMNGAMYFVEMDQDGGKGLNNNRAGAKYGTGYCDAQCPHDMKFISGEANSVGWTPNPKDKSKNMGRGKYGSCCGEMDIWEANSMANAYTPHPCNVDGQLRCEGKECGDNERGERYQGVCDKDGCDINPYRMGNRKFFGRGEEFEVNTLKPITVVTQFLTADGTDDGKLSEMRRFYVQDGKVVHSPKSTILGRNDTDSITDNFCHAKKDLFGDVNDYAKKGGSEAMGDSLDRGHVMAVSLWDDVEVNMLWLDSAFPLDKPESSPGVRRGDCPGGDESTPTYVRQKYPDGWVSFQSAFVGPVGSFLSQPPPPPPTPAPCVAGCTAVNGQQQPECKGQSQDRCKFMMQYEKKCQWKSCPTPTPAPTTMPTTAPTAQPTLAPTQPPSPTPTPCQMVDAAVPTGRRCKGKPAGGWGKLGKGLTPDECQQACLAEASCKFAAYKQGVCSNFGVCKKTKKQAGFTIWRRTCDADPSPNPACLPLCEKVDLTVGGEACDYLSKFPVLCNQTRVRDGNTISPCRATSTSCVKSTWDALECPMFDAQCSSQASLSELASHRSHGDLEEKGRVLTKWRFNKWRALVQITQSVRRMEL